MSSTAEQLMKRLLQAPSLGLKLITSWGTRVFAGDALARFIDYTGAGIMLDKPHSIIDRGGMQTVQGKVTINPNSTYYIAGITKNVDVHFVQHAFKANAGNIEIRLFEDATFDEVNEVIPENRNRRLQSAIESNFRVFLDPTNPGNMTAFDPANPGNPHNEIGFIDLPDSAGPVSGGSETGEGDEFILDGYQRTRKYILAIKNLDNVANRKVSFQLGWYEPAKLMSYPEFNELYPQ